MILIIFVSVFFVVVVVVLLLYLRKDNNYSLSIEKVLSFNMTPLFAVAGGFQPAVSVRSEVH